MLQVLKFLALILAFSFLSGCTQSESPLSSDREVPESTPQLLEESPVASTTSEKITAQFEIRTNGTKRIFTETKYHHQSPDVYIESQDPNIIHVGKPSVTWGDFFETLPMELTKDCLITGTKQTFCSNDTKKLRFFLNGVETSNALELEIQDGSFLQVVYGT